MAEDFLQQALSKLGMGWVPGAIDVIRGRDEADIAREYGTEEYKKSPQYESLQKTQKEAQDYEKDFWKEKFTDIAERSPNLGEYYMRPVVAPIVQGSPEQFGRELGEPGIPPPPGLEQSKWRHVGSRWIGPEADPTTIEGYPHPWPPGELSAMREALRTYHTVKEGEVDLADIAREYGVTVEYLWRVNKDRIEVNPAGKYVLKPGQKLIVKTGRYRIGPDPSAFPGQALVSSPRGLAGDPLRITADDTRRQISEILARESRHSTEELMIDPNIALFDKKTGRLAPAAYKLLAEGFSQPQRGKTLADWAVNPLLRPSGPTQLPIGLSQEEMTGQPFIDSGIGEHLEARLGALPDPPVEGYLQSLQSDWSQRPGQRALHTAGESERDRRQAVAEGFVDPAVVLDLPIFGRVAVGATSPLRPMDLTRDLVMGRAGLFDAPAYMLNGAKKLLNWTVGTAGTWGDWEHAVRHSPRAVFNLIMRIPELGIETLWTAKELLKVVATGRIEKRDKVAFMRLVGTAKKAWNRTGKHYENLPDRSFSQEAFDLFVGFTLGVSDVLNRTAAGAIGSRIDEETGRAIYAGGAADFSDLGLFKPVFGQEGGPKGLRELGPQFSESAVDFATPLVKSFKETVFAAPGVMLWAATLGYTDLPVIVRKAPLEVALNLTMAKALAKAPLMKAHARAREVVSREVTRVKNQVGELGPALKSALEEVARQKKPPPLPGSLPRLSLWGKRSAGEFRKGEITEADLVGMKNRLEALMERSQKATKEIDLLNEKGSHLKDLADVMDMSGYLFGETIFSTLNLAKMIVRRSLEGSIGSSVERWIFMPRDMKLGEEFLMVEREMAGVHKADLLKAEQLIQSIPKKYRPIIEEMMWMEHQPLFNIDPAKNLISWSGKKWVLTDLAKSKVYAHRTQWAKDFQGLWREPTPLQKTLMDDLSSRSYGHLEAVADYINKEFAANPHSAEAVQLFGQLEKIVKSIKKNRGTPEQIALANEIAAKVGIANRFGRGIAQQFHQLTSRAQELGMFVDQSTLRQIYFPNFYTKFDFFGRIKQAIKGRGKKHTKLSPSPDGSQFMVNMLRQLKIPIEARRVGLGDDLSHVINIAEDSWHILPENLERYSMRSREMTLKDGSTKTVHEFNPREFLRKRQSDGQGGWALDSGLMQNAMNGITRLSYDVSMFELYRHMSRNPQIASSFKKAGFIEVSAEALSKSQEAYWKTKMMQRKLEAGQTRSPYGERVAPKPPQKYGDLSGKWLQEDIWHEMVNMAKFMEEAPGFWRTTLRRWKQGMTAWSPTTSARNVLTNVLLFAPMANISVINPMNWQYYARSLKDAFSPRTSRSRHWREAFVDGAFDGTFHRTELFDKMPGVYRRLRDAKNGPEFVRALFNLTVDISIGKHAAWEIPGKLYGIGDDIFRQAYHHKFKAELGRAAATKGSRKYFIDYESVQGFVQIARAPFRPIFHEPSSGLAKVLGGKAEVSGPVPTLGGSWRTAGIGMKTGVAEISAAAGVFWTMGQPFLAFTARALPLVIEWMQTNPAMARMYLNLHDHLTRISMEEAGLDPEMVWREISTMSADKRSRYNPGGLLFQALGIGPKKKKGPFGTEISFPTMDSAWVTPFDLITAQFDPYRESSSRLQDAASRLFLRTPFLGPLISLAINRDPLTGRPILPDGTGVGDYYKYWEVMASFLTRRWLPPITPSPTDVPAFMRGEAWEDDREDTNERWQGGYTYESLRSAYMGKPNYKQEVIDLTDWVYRLLGAKVLRGMPSEHAIANAGRFDRVVESLALFSIRGHHALQNTTMAGLRDDVPDRELRLGAMRKVNEVAMDQVKILKEQLDMLRSSEPKREIMAAVREFLRESKRNSEEQTYAALMELLGAIRMFKMEQSEFRQEKAIERIERLPRE